ncbi:MAG: 3-hydroxybutyryl-CoA dehydrogenase [Chloroflexota bacterium]|nr:3-hydroxybutyryl-CoA dehydrogenase [Chloroflexota bacterium]
MEIKTVGVIGCGQMGRGIAEVCARHGYQTKVTDVSQELLDNGVQLIERSLTVAAKRGKMTEQDKDDTLSRLHRTLDIGDFGDCDLVIEAAVENLEEKKKVFVKLDEVCPSHSVLASNTSCLSVLDMAMSTNRPDKVIGMHFFNPVPVMKLVEIVKTIVSSDETIDTSRSFADTLEKTVILAQDSPGFIVNRLLMPYLLGAVRMLESGVASKGDIDQGMVLGCNHPMGPLTLLDYIGLDTSYFIASAMYEEFKDPLYAPPILVKKMVAAGHLGRKSGKGFFDYK